MSDYSFSSDEVIYTTIKRWWRPNWIVRSVLGDITTTDIRPPYKIITSPPKPAQPTNTEDK